MTTTDLKEKATELREKATDLMKDEITFTKLDFFLVAAICLLGGICIGLLIAPFTHGVMIGSNNGNNNGNNNGHNGNNTEHCNLDDEKERQE